MPAPVGALLLGAEWTSAAGARVCWSITSHCCVCCLCVCVLGCALLYTVVVHFSCAMCYGDVRPGGLQDGWSRSNWLHCPQSVILFSEPSASELFFVSFLCVCLTISLSNSPFLPQTRCFSSPFFPFSPNTCSILRHLWLAGLSATAVRPRGALM